MLFHELTKNAIIKAVAEPQKLNPNKYKAQQARRVLDRLVGYHLSPLLWKKVKRGLSAGRVQSVALRIICERERAIFAFEPEEYWSVTAHLGAKTPPPFTAKLVKKNNKKIKISDKQGCDSILADLEQADFAVQRVSKRTVKQNPLPPFITSKLQQEAIYKLRFSARKTMSVAQQLYEGIDLGPGEPVGLITYMRTDSTRIANEAAEEARSLIEQQFGPSFALEKPRFYKNRKKAQDAHEAIRPTSVFNTPKAVAPHLSKDQLALYELIWKRFVATQMKPALIDKVSVSIEAGEYLFNAGGSTIRFQGFMSVYRSVDDEIENEQKKKTLPELSQGLPLTVSRIEPKQHFTMPPPRFSEASLVKELEENGIGRPSTYTAILSTIRNKGYVVMVKGYFRPNELGFIVNDLIVDSFPDLVNVDFTARMEDNLDRIEAAQMDYLHMMSQFYEEFQKQLETAGGRMLSMRGQGLPTRLSCPKCNKKLHIKMGRNGHFLACSGYPDCTYTSNYDRDDKGDIRASDPFPAAIVTETACNQCGKPMALKQGRYGSFLACTGYPECKNTQSTHSNGPETKTGVTCPENGCEGELIQKKSKKGKLFYGCNRYPDCNFATWNKPIPESCPQCGTGFLVEKTTKKDGTFNSCLTPGCRYQG